MKQAVERYSQEMNQFMMMQSLGFSNAGTPQDGGMPIGGLSGGSIGGPIGGGFGLATVAPSDYSNRSRSQLSRHETDDVFGSILTHHEVMSQSPAQMMKKSITFGV